MARIYFGTDGIRGLTNMSPMTAAMAMKVGMAAGAHFLRGDHKHRVVIGKDTRLSGYMLENAMVAGFTAVGMDVVLVGPMPTPAVAMLVHSMRADLGVMISASHNPFADNGIKLFGPDGYKPSDADEAKIEALARENGQHELAGGELGEARIESGELLRLAGENDGVGLLQQTRQVGRGGDAGAGREYFRRVVIAADAGEIGGLRRLFGQEAVDHGRGHASGSQKCDLSHEEALCAACARRDA